MSLRIWLPLNGDLHNQGLDGELNFSTAGTVSDADGKIGTNSKYFNSSGIVSDYNLTLGNEASACFWIYYTAFPSSSGNDWIFHLGTTTTGYANTVFGLSTRYRDYFVLIAKGQHNDNNNERIEHNLSLNQWYHICFTWKNNDSAKLYINGNLYTTITNLNNGTKATINKIALGMNSNASSTRLQGRLNDFRFYDHCLSAKEVKEISKGLILHYKLDEKNNANWLLPNDEKIITRASKNTFVDYDYNSALTSCTETSYTIEFLAKGSVDNMKLDMYFRNSGGTAYAVTQQQILTTDWKFYTLTLNGDPSTMAIFRARCYSGTAGDTISLRNVRLISNQTPINGTIIYDSSGYSNNGTVVESLTAAASSPRYSAATNFSGSNGFTYDHFVTSDSKLDECTFSAWVKRTYTDTSSNKYIFSGPIEVYLYTTFVVQTSWNAQQAGSETYTSNGWRTSGTIPLNEWTHIVLTFKNGTFMCYINGSYKGTSSRAAFIRGYRSPGSVGSSFIGGISDLRFYMTALSATEVKELYDTSGSIDSQGNVYAREFVSQNNASFQLSKTGIVTSPYFLENSNNQASINNNEVGDNQKEIISYQFYEY